MRTVFATRIVPCLVSALLALAGSAACGGDGTPAGDADARFDRAEDARPEVPVDVGPDEEPDASDVGDDVPDVSDYGDSDAMDYDFGVLGCLYQLLEVIVEVGMAVGDLGTVGTCPTVTRDTTTITLDFGSGCDPWPDDAVADTWSGSMTVTLVLATRSISVAFTDLVINGESVTGSLDGTYERGSGTVTLAIGVDVIMSAGACDIDGNIVAAVTRTDITVDGSLTVSGTALTMDGLVIAYADLFAYCPLPHAGSVTYDDARLGYVTITFDVNSPVDGTVDVTVAGFTVTDVPFCDYYAGGG